ncbi:UNVERIFIED_CONTAM: hypothetical protein GTU68_029101 [Idotea baltica]|nr:hypothetical protein [Idotea baltica]
MSKIKIDSIESAIEDIKAGKLIIVVDDADRENEGDFIVAAEHVTPEIVNFMATHGRGLICAALLEKRCEELDLELMVGKNSSLHATPFTVSVDYLKDGVTTGISASDRAKTIQALVKPDARPEDFGRPGHIFPLKAKVEGVLRRAGHTEATIDFARLAGLQPAGALVEIMNEDGSMARLPQLREIADRFDLKLVTIADLIEYRLKHDSLITREIGVEMPTKFGDFELIAFRQLHTEMIHMALIKGSWEEDEAVLVRVHSSCVTGDIFGSCRCDCGEQLDKAMEMVEEEGKGVILYMNQEGRGIGLMNKLKAYKLQEQGFKMDERDYGVGAQILRDLGVSKMRLMSNNPKKRSGLIGYGLEIVDQVAIEVEPNPHNFSYLKTKQDKMGHNLHIG